MATPAPSPRSPWLRLRQQLYALAAGGPAARRIAHTLMLRLHQLHARHFPGPDDIELRIEHELVILEEQAELGTRGSHVGGRAR